ncbi:MAG: DUF3870 domain-containing protein [Peptococcaceae bacterium]
MSIVKTLYLVGNSRFPQNVPARVMYEYCTVSLEVEPKYFVIMRGSCTLANEHGQKFISSLVEGQSLLQGIEPLVETIDSYYHGNSKNAIIGALRELYRKFENDYLNSTKSVRVVK